MAELSPVTLVRYCNGTVGERARTVHFILAHATEGEIVSAMCGTLLNVHDIETVPLNQGIPCNACLMTRTMSVPAQALDHANSKVTITVPIYQAWGWPVTHDGDQVRLRLDRCITAIAIPITHSVATSQILTARRCAPPVLTHPRSPDHHIILAGERYGVRLTWPPSVHQVTDTLLLPPTLGSLAWIQLPERDSLRLCREIDVFAALRIALNGHLDNHREGMTVGKSDNNNDDKGSDDDAGRHREEDNTGNGSRDRPIPPPPDPNKHDR